MIGDISSVFNTSKSKNFLYHITDIINTNRLAAKSQLFTRDRTPIKITSFIQQSRYIFFQNSVVWVRIISIILFNLFSSYFVELDCSLIIHTNSRPKFNIIIIITITTIIFEVKLFNLERVMFRSTSKCQYFTSVEKYCI